MAYSFTVPARADISRKSENVFVKILSISIVIDRGFIGVVVSRINTDNFSTATFDIQLSGDDFLSISSVLTRGGSIYEEIKAAVWSVIRGKIEAELSFNGPRPLDVADTDGTLFEKIPVWVEKA